MNFHRLLRLPRKLSPSTSASVAWRIKQKQTQLISQLTTALLQRRDWPQVIRTLNLTSAILTPSFFLRVLHRTQSHPQISLEFYNWVVKSRLGFQPDIITLCKLSQILIGSGYTVSAKSILESLILTYPPTDIVDSYVQASTRGKYVIIPVVLDSIVECYCDRELHLQALELIRRAHEHGHLVSIVSCNSVLHLLDRVNEIRLAWCLFSLIIRNWVSFDQSTWSIVAGMLSRDGKFDLISRILDLGLAENAIIFDTLIDHYSGIGNFGDAFRYLNMMITKNLNPGFRTYSSILNGACKYQNSSMIETVMCTMKMKGFFRQPVSTDYDCIICKLSDLDKTHAMEMLWERAGEEKIVLKAVTYGRMMSAFSREGRVTEAIWIYRKDLKLGDDCYYPFMNALCRCRQEDEAAEEAGDILIDLIRKGFYPSEQGISKFIRFNRAEKLLDVILEEGLVPDSSCCSWLVDHYCRTGRVDSAVRLHEKMEKLGGVFNGETYDNVLLKELVKEKRTDEAMEIFCYMKRKGLISSLSFSIMITGLCEGDEMRKAMELHDEMMKMELKPDKERYKELIHEFM